VSQRATKKWQGQLTKSAADVTPPTPPCALPGRWVKREARRSTGKRKRRPNALACGRERQGRSLRGAYGPQEICRDAAQEERAIRGGRAEPAWFRQAVPIANQGLVRPAPEKRRGNNTPPGEARRPVDKRKPRPEALACDRELQDELGGHCSKQGDDGCRWRGQ
jgi:hypothetical protein